jgi:DNA-binding CsgD family transcriptional regulator
MELLSAAAGNLLARLTAGGGVPVGTGPGAVRPGDPALRELREYGLVVVSGRRAMPVAPTSRLANLLAGKQQQLMDSNRRLIEDYERLMSLGMTRAPGQVEILACAADIPAALDTLRAEATGEYRAIDLLPPAPEARPRTPHRLIYTENLLSERGVGGLDGWQCRMTGDLPLRLAISDRAALIVLPANDSATVLRLPAVIAALRHYFDLLWCQAVPLDGAESRQLTKAQRLILSMLLSGMGDEAIARCLTVSSRSVRRQVASLELLAGVSSRFALGAAAVALGWVDPGGSVR